MRQSPEEIVRTVIARHLQVARATIARRTHLQRDLELDPLDLVLIALRIANIKGIEFPIARLEATRTVADRVDVVRSLGARSSDENAFTLDEPHPKRVVGA
jgi:acyl carrier protein